MCSWTIAPRSPSRLSGCGGGSGPAVHDQDHRAVRVAPGRRRSNRRLLFAPPSRRRLLLLMRCGRQAYSVGSLTRGAGTKPTPAPCPAGGVAIPLGWQRRLRGTRQHDLRLLLRPSSLTHSLSSPAIPALSGGHFPPARTKVFQFSLRAEQDRGPVSLLPHLDWSHAACDGARAWPPEPKCAALVAAPGGLPCARSRHRPG